MTLTLPGFGPTPGDRYKNRAINLYATVVEVRQRRRCWVLLRVNDGERELPLDELIEFWRPV